MHIETFISKLKSNGIEFYTGVPDSQLKSLCNYLIKTYGAYSPNKHIIAANEGNAVALAAGYHLSTGKVPCVYLQNSGLGNTINPISSLLNDNVYGIPSVFIIGWRGEPGINDEPQHLYQGKITLKLLELMDIQYSVIDKDTSEMDLINILEQFKPILENGKSIAFVVKKNSLFYEEKLIYENKNSTYREKIIQHITEVAKEDIIISTTGKTSRELFEIRENNGQSHKYDFLTVGSMGHSSSIALGIALNKPKTRIWCLDGDGAILMHMGAMGIIGAMAPENFIHIVINNSSHESVGGMPTIGDNISFIDIAQGCGYKKTYLANGLNELDSILSKIIGKKGPIFIEVKSAIGSRNNLGRPTTSPKENKNVFMEYINKLE